jgi:RNase P subunit RPR2
MNPYTLTEVYCSTCKEWRKEGDTDPTNIEEDMFGADVVTFTCGVCNEEHKSNVRILRR